MNIGFCLSSCFAFTKRTTQSILPHTSWYTIEKVYLGVLEDGGNIGGSRIHFPSVPGKYLADLRSRANSQQYSSIYED